MLPTKSQYGLWDMGLRFFAVASFQIWVMGYGFTFFVVANFQIWVMGHGITFFVVANFQIWVIGYRLWVMSLKPITIPYFKANKNNPYIPFCSLVMISFVL